MTSLALSARPCRRGHPRRGWVLLDKPDERWRRAHEDFFTREGVARFLGTAPVIGDDTLVVTEWFRLVRPVGSDRA
jgi:hypothetical protein